MRTNVPISKLLTTQSEIALLKLLLKKGKVALGAQAPCGKFLSYPKSCNHTQNLWRSALYRSIRINMEGYVNVRGQLFPKHALYHLGQQVNMDCSKGLLLDI